MIENKKLVLVSPNKIPTLRFALRHLTIASALIGNSASGEFPFQLSKLLNVMGKMTGDNAHILSMLLGDITIKPSDFDNSFDSPTVKLFKVLIEELNENSSISIKGEK